MSWRNWSRWRWKFDQRKNNQNPFLFGGRNFAKPLFFISTFLLINSVTVSGISLNFFGKEPKTGELIPEEWRNSFSTIGGIIEALKKAIHYEKESEFPLFLNLALLHIYHGTLNDRISRVLVVPKDILGSNDGEFFSTSLRFMKYSSSAYGALLGMVMGVAEKPAMGTDALQPESYSDEANICRRLEINETDIVLMSLHHDSVSEMVEKVFQPRYFIAVDHTTKSIVVSIKGTASVSDLAKDLVCHSVPFFTGEAHSGIKMAAEKIYEEAIGKIAEASEQFPGYRVVLCGHSLGGGTAILLKILIHEKQLHGSVMLNPSIKIDCFAYAPPPVFQGSLPETMIDGIHIFVNHHDIVPRLSLGSVYHLFREIRAIDQLGLSMADRLKIIAMEYVSDLLRKRERRKKLKHAISLVQEATEHPPIINLENGLAVKFEPLQLIGKVYHLYRTKKRKRRSPPNYTMIKTENSFFSAIRIYSDCFINHHPNSYEEALESVVMKTTKNKEEEANKHEDL